MKKQKSDQIRSRGSGVMIRHTNNQTNRDYNFIYRFNWATNETNSQVQVIKNIIETVKFRTVVSGVHTLKLFLSRY